MDKWQRYSPEAAKMVQSEITKSDEPMPPRWILCTTPDPMSNTRATPFRLFFGSKARTQLDALTPGIDGTDYRRGLDCFLAAKQKAFAEIRDELPKRQGQGQAGPQRGYGQGLTG